MLNSKERKNNHYINAALKFAKYQVSNIIPINDNYIVNTEIRKKSSTLIKLILHENVKDVNSLRNKNEKFIELRSRIENSNNLIYMLKILKKVDKRSYNIVSEFLVLTDFKNFKKSQYKKYLSSKGVIIEQNATLETILYNLVNEENYRPRKLYLRTILISIWRKLSKWNSDIASLITIILFVSATISYFTVNRKPSLKTPIKKGLFQEMNQEYLNVLLLPFNPNQRCVEKMSNYEMPLFNRYKDLSLSENLPINLTFKKCVKYDSTLNLIVPSHNYISEAEAFIEGFRENADIVIWGDFVDDCIDDSLIRLRYLVINQSVLYKVFKGEFGSFENFAKLLKISKEEVNKRFQRALIPYSIDSELLIGKTEFKDIENLIELEKGFLQEDIDNLLYKLSYIHYCKIRQFDKALKYLEKNKTENILDYLENKIVHYSKFAENEGDLVKMKKSINSYSKLKKGTKLHRFNLSYLKKIKHYNYAEAVSYLDSLILIDSQYQMTYINNAISLSDKCGEFEKAISITQFAISIVDSNSFEYQKLLATNIILHAKSNNIAESLRLEKMVKYNIRNKSYNSIHVDMLLGLLIGLHKNCEINLAYEFYLKLEEIIKNKKNGLIETKFYSLNGNGEIKLKQHFMFENLCSDKVAKLVCERKYEQALEIIHEIETLGRFYLKMQMFKPILYYNLRNNEKSKIWSEMIKVRLKQQKFSPDQIKLWTDIDKIAPFEEKQLSNWVSTETNFQCVNVLNKNPTLFKKSDSFEEKSLKFNFFCFKKDEDYSQPILIR